MVWMAAKCTGNVAAMVKIMENSAFAVIHLLEWEMQEKEMWKIHNWIKI